MNYINGIGGLFFRAQDPKKLKKWYIETLGIVIKDYVWQQQAGPTVFEPFSCDSDYFDKDKQWMINFRVKNLSDLILRLKSKGVEVEERAEWNSPEVGNFARIYDPEDNPVELWEPAG